MTTETNRRSHRLCGKPDCGCTNQQGWTRCQGPRLKAELVLKYIVKTSDDDDLVDVLSAILNAEGEIDPETIISVPPLLKRTSSGRREIHGKALLVWIEEDSVDCDLTAAEAIEIGRIGYSSRIDLSIVHWGTRRTSVNDLRAGLEGVEIRFDTAWTPLVPALLKLREMYPEVDFEFRCRFEDDPEFQYEITEESAIDHTRLLRMLQF